MSELLDHQYHAREKQIIAIAAKAEEDFREEISAKQKSWEAFVSLLTTSPILLPEIIRRRSCSEDAFYELVMPTVVMTAKRVFCLGILSPLLEACSPESRRFKEIFIDLCDFSAPPELRAAYKNHQDLLDKIINNGREAGTINLLSSLEGSTPLMRYRRDITEGKFRLIPTLDGGEICYLGTKVPEVNLKLWYPFREKLPKLSLVVDDLQEIN